MTLRPSGGKTLPPDELITKPDQSSHAVRLCISATEP